jgi:uncharacterized protein
MAPNSTPVGRALVIYLAAVFLGAAAVAPWVWKLVQALAPGSGLAGQPFHRYVNRCLLVLALAGLWPLLRAIGIRSCREIGLPWRSVRPLEIALGVLAGLGSLAIVAALALAFHARAWRTDHTAADMLRHFLNAGFTAIAVSLLEEILFRGAIFGAFRREGRFATAAAWSSGIYALVHFFQRPLPPETIGPLSGFVTLGQMCAGFVDWQALVPGFLNLALAGWLLAWSRERSGTLWFAIGLHAGWIFWLKSYGFFTRTLPLRDVWIWGSARLIDGWIALLALALLAIVLPRLVPRRPDARETPQA